MYISPFELMSVKAMEEETVEASLKRR